MVKITMQLECPECKAVTEWDDMGWRGLQDAQYQCPRCQEIFAVNKDGETISMSEEYNEQSDWIKFLSVVKEGKGFHAECISKFGIGSIECSKCNIDHPQINALCTETDEGGNLFCELSKIVLVFFDEWRKNK